MVIRRCILALTVLALFAGLASAQVGVATGGPTGTPLACSANVAVPPQLRQEGQTEAVGDIVLTCTGGTSPVVGTTIPAANITITLGTQVTSRILDTTQNPNFTEALLLIDEPGSGLPGPAGLGPNLAQTKCATPLSGCVAAVGALGQAVIPTTTTSSPNVYQGVISNLGASFQVTFNGVPVLPPVSAGVSRVYRITNIRANASNVASGLGGVGPLQASIAISGSTSLPVNNPVVTVGFVQTSLRTTFRNNANSADSTSATGFNQCNSSTLAFVNILRYQENVNFATAFKTRVAPTALATGQSGTVFQNIPGVIYNSESDFITPAVPGAGLADFGTRLRAVFSNIPTGMRIFVSTTNVLNAFNTITGPATVTSSFAQLVISETAPDSASGAVPASPVTGTCSGTGSCPFIGTGIPYAEVLGGEAVWEVVNTNPSVAESFDFAVFTTYTGNQSANTPPQGTGSVDMSYAPVIGGTASGAASSTLSVPRFVDNVGPVPVLRINLCQTVLLFPYVTNAGGLDTGIAISNTSKDTFGTTNQSGTCALTFFGNATVPVYTTPVITAGDANTNTNDWAFTISDPRIGLNPGFQGYAIAVCNFQFAHAIAFISDVGLRNFAMGYLALVFNNGSFTAITRGGNAEILEN